MVGLLLLFVAGMIFTANASIIQKVSLILWLLKVNYRRKLLVIISPR